VSLTFLQRLRSEGVYRTEYFVQAFAGNCPGTIKMFCFSRGSAVFKAATLTEYPNVFSAEALRFQEGQQVGVNGIGLGRGHAVRKALVGFQCAIL
jgi:hypothetical protein